jgi:hypothetical protein
MHLRGLQRNTAWTEDRATLRSDPSAVPGAKTEGQAVHGNMGCPPSLLRDWQQSDKPSRQDAAIRMAGCPQQFANDKSSKFQFPVNQDRFGWRERDVPAERAWTCHGG